MKYSIWAVPPEPVLSQLKKIIKEASEKYDSPVMEPHITIVGNIEAEVDSIEDVSKKIISSKKEFELTLGEVSFSTTYFQSVFVRVKSQASLMQLNIDLKEAFGLNNDVFMPHMSLFYGDHDMDIREKIAKEISSLSGSFMVKEVVIVPSTKNPNEWKHLKTISF